MPARQRRADVRRTTGETAVEVSLAVDGSGQAEISARIGFFDRMLELFAHYGRFDLVVRDRGDLRVDGHHAVEDMGMVALDLSGRPFLDHDLEFGGLKAGDLDADLTSHFPSSRGHGSK
jgi:imidazoleglycerol phosphate dehydratase HisB